MKIILLVLFLFITVLHAFPQADFRITVQENSWGPVTNSYMDFKVWIKIENIGDERDWCKALQGLQLTCDPYLYHDIELTEYSEIFKSYIDPGESIIGYLLFKVPLDADNISLEISTYYGGGKVFLSKSYFLNVLKKTFGGSGEDWAYSLITTKDDGYVLSGITESQGAREEDIWIIKLDSKGNKLWEKSHYSTKSDLALGITETTDGGYMVAGMTEAYGSGKNDIWIIKLDSKGNRKWSKTYGGKKDDWAVSVKPTIDGNYIIAGTTESYGLGNSDFWIIKINNKGKKLWKKTFGGRNSDIAYSIILSEHGGYVVIGSTESFGSGGKDFWIIKLNENGDIQWEKTFGGSDDDVPLSIAATTYGGYIVAGYTRSYAFGSKDFWIIKLNGSGEQQWEKTFGGKEDDVAYSVISKIDGSFIVVGSTYSYGAGKGDFWIIKLDENGEKVWEKTYGGKENDVATSIVATGEGGYAVAGWTDSFSAGKGDFWIIKLDKDGSIQEF